MSRAAAPPSPIPAAAQELCLTLELARENDAALLRVVSTLHRRRCRVLDASFRGAGSAGSAGSADGGTDRLELRIQAPGQYAARVEHWLRGLVDVHHATVQSTSVI
jgi:hypothetical protein